MANLNRVILAGNLTRDPQLSYTPANTAVCKFGIAINRRWTDRQTNEQREDTTFVECTAFGRTGETINQYMTKGRPIFIDGRLQYSTWTGQDGQKKSKLEVVVETFQFMDSRPGGGGERSPRPAAQTPSEPPGAPVDDYPPPQAYAEADIPF